jgi:hypothetical protein
MTEFTQEGKINFLVAMDIIQIANDLKYNTYDYICSVLTGKNANYTPYARMSDEVLNERFDIVYQKSSHFKNPAKIYKLAAKLKAINKSKEDVSNETKA